MIGTLVSVPISRFRKSTRHQNEFLPFPPRRNLEIPNFKSLLCRTNPAHWEHSNSSSVFISQKISTYIQTSLARKEKMDFGQILWPAYINCSIFWGNQSRQIMLLGLDDPSGIFQNYTVLGSRHTTGIAGAGLPRKIDHRSTWTVNIVLHFQSYLLVPYIIIIICLQRCYSLFPLRHPAFHL